MKDWTCLVPKCGFETNTAEALIEHLLKHKPATALDDHLRILEGQLADWTTKIREMRSLLA